MKLEYFSLGLVFIVITHVPHVYTRIQYTWPHCCPNHRETYPGKYCQNGEVIRSYGPNGAGAYCKTLKKCLAEPRLTSFPCKMLSNSEEHLCSNQTAAVCRGTVTSNAACRK